MNLPELLAPAGAMEQLITALRFGADAVYGGMERYGLRAFAGNFSPEALFKAVAYCHERGKKFYVTMNSYPFDEDMEGFLKAGKLAFRAGADAAIVSDLGAISLLRERVPGLPIHVSTQANTLNTAAAMVYLRLGVQRIIVAREMSINQIETMRQNLPPCLELEAFCHGAACMAHSGRCLLSNALAGRGANQGACAQPCRWQYAVVEQKRPGVYMPVSEDLNGTYIFSAQDLNLMPLLPALVRAGLSSLKIEGRMKTEYYVATVVSAYRRGLDELKKGEDAFLALLPSLLAELSKASHRDSNTGFAEEKPAICGGADGFHQSMEYVGRVTQSAAPFTQTQVMLKNRFFVGDALEVLTPKGVFPYVPENITLLETGESVPSTGVCGATLLLQFPFPVSEGDFIRGPVRNHRE